MKKKRIISSDKLRAMLDQMANEICNTTDRVVLSLKGNTFEIDLSGATINITINEKGGVE